MCTDGAAIVAVETLPIVHQLSPGSASDDPEGQKLMAKVPKAMECGMRPVVPPKSNRIKPWRYSKKLYKQRHIVECNFRNIKQFRRVFARYDKWDETYNAFIAIANIAITLRN